MSWLEYAIAALAMAGLACAGWWGMYQSPNQPANLQAKLEHAANTALEHEGMVWASARLDGQHALIFGEAPSREAVDEAAEIVLTSSGPGGLLAGGVTQVENAATLAAPRSDFTWIARKTSAGVLELSGEVPSHLIAQQLVEDAERAGNGSVENSMAVAGGAPGHNWQGTARFAVSQLASLDEGEAKFSGTELTIIGQTSDAAVRDRIKAQIKSLVAPYSGRALVYGEVLWRAQATADHVVLEGAVATQSVRINLVEAAGRDRAIVDHQSVGPTYLNREHVATLAIAMEVFPGVAEGTLSMDEFGLAIMGRAEADQVEQLRATLGDRLSPDRTIIEIVEPEQP